MKILLFCSVRYNNRKLWISKHIWKSLLWIYIRRYSSQSDQRFFLFRIWTQTREVNWQIPFVVIFFLLICHINWIQNLLEMVVVHLKVSTTAMTLFLLKIFSTHSEQINALSHFVNCYSNDFSCFMCRTLIIMMGHMTSHWFS